MFRALVLLAFATHVHAGVAPDTLWTRTYGGPDPDVGYDIHETADGGFVATGLTQSRGIDGDVWLLRTDSNGDTLWTSVYGGPGSDSGRSVRELASGGYLVAATLNEDLAGPADLGLVEFDSAGTVVWDTTYGGPAFDFAHDLLPTADGGFLLVGGTESFGAGARDAWVIKIAPDYAEDWQATYGGSSNDYLYDAVEMPGGGYALIGGIDSFGMGDRDVWLVRLDSLGTVVDDTTFGTALYEEGHTLDARCDGGYNLFGRRRAPTLFDAWVIVVDAALDYQSDDTYGGSGNDIGIHGVTRTDCGAGGFGHATADSTATDADLWTFSVDEGGALCGELTIVSPGPDEGGALDTTADGGMIGTGRTGSALWIGRFAPPPCDLSVDLPDTTLIVSPGDTAVISTLVSNTCAQGLTFDRADVDVTGPASLSNTVLNGWSLSVPPGGSIAGAISQAVPPQTPSGSYTVTFMISRAGAEVASDSMSVVVP